MKMESQTHQWKEVQRKTFTKWVNARLAEQGLQPIKDILEDLDDGVVLNRLCEKIDDVKIIFNQTAPTRFQKLENVQVFFEFLREKEINLVNIRTSDIVDKNSKLTLGLIWTMIIRLNLKGLGSEDSEIKKAVLSWCRAVTSDYDGVNIKNFSGSWKNGLAFNAILHKFGPENIGKFSDLEKKSAKENLKGAFDAAYNFHKIPKLLEVEDLLNSSRPDEASIFTYVSEFYNKFKDIILEEKRDFQNLENYVTNATNEYETKAGEFKQKNFELKIERENIVKKISEVYEDLKNFKEKASENFDDFLNLCSLFGNINLIYKKNNVEEFKTQNSPETLVKIINTPENAILEEKEKLNELDSFLKSNLLKETEKIRSEIQRFDFQNKNEIEELKELKKDEKFTKIVDEKLKIIGEVEKLENYHSTKIMKASNIFNKFDFDNSGKISIGDYKNCCNLLGFEGKMTDEFIYYKNFEAEVDAKFKIDFNFVKIGKKISFKNLPEEIENLNQIK